MRILDARGYSVPNEYTNDSGTTDREMFEEFKRQSIRIPYESVFVLKKGVTSRHPAKLDVRIYDSVKDGLKVQKAIKNHFEKKVRNEPLNILVVFNVPKDLNDNVSVGSLEVMCYQQLLVNPLNHIRCPLHITKLNDQEKTELMLGLQGKKLVRLRTVDPIALFLDATSGDVIRYEDARLYTGQSLSTVEYKMVD